MKNKFFTRKFVPAAHTTKSLNFSSSRIRRLWRGMVIDMRIAFAEIGWNDYLYWQAQDKKTLKRINQLLQSIERDGPLSGIGKPELLRHGKSGSYSRRIDEANRLIYQIGDNQIIVKSCRGHYED